MASSTMRSRSDAATAGGALVHRAAGRDEPHAGQLERVPRLLGDGQMTEMDRVEDAAEYAPSLGAG